MPEYADVVALVVDSGSYTCKAGFAGDDVPTSVFPSLVGRHGYSGPMIAQGMKPAYVGNEAQSKRGILSLRRPVQSGIVTNWEDMEMIWAYAFEEDLDVAPEEHPILLTEPPLNPKPNREKTLEVMFETFKAPAVSLYNQASLCLYGQLNTGTVVLSGEDVSYIVPVYSGHVIEHGVIRFGIAGRALTDRLMEDLSKTNDQALTTAQERDVVEEVKEKTCYVAMDFQHELGLRPSNLLGRAYELPDGKTLNFDKERFRIPEALFQPSLIDGAQREGIHHAIHRAISQCDEELHRGLYRNIVLTGGCTMFPGLADRLLKEVAALVPADMRTSIKIAMPPERKYMVWIGGSILASLSTFQNLWVPKAEYDEHGPGIVHRRCL